MYCPIGPFISLYGRNLCEGFCRNEDYLFDGRGSNFEMTDGVNSIWAVMKGYIQSYQKRNLQVRITPGFSLGILYKSESRLFIPFLMRDLSSNWIFLPNTRIPKIELVIK